MIIKPEPKPGQIWEDDFGYQIMITTPVSIGGPGIPDKLVVGCTDRFTFSDEVPEWIKAFREYDIPITLHHLANYYTLIQE
jgi:hypothetical protein